MPAKKMQNGKQLFTANSIREVVLLGHGWEWFYFYSASDQFKADFHLHWSGDKYRTLDATCFRTFLVETENEEVLW